MKVKFTTLTALAYAIEAYHHNKKQIVRVSEQDLVANSKLILNGLENNHSIIQPIDEKHFDQAQDCITYLQQMAIMKTLIGNRDQFLQTISEIISHDQIDSKNLGLLAWAPKLVDDYRRINSIKEISACYEPNSQWEGSPGDKISMQFRLIERRYNPEYKSYSAYGYNENNNLIFYWTKNSEKIVENGKIVGRIKEHRRDNRRGNACVTVLHYVKNL